MVCGKVIAGGQRVDRLFILVGDFNLSVNLARYSPSPLHKRGGGQVGEDGETPSLSFL